ncbi:RNA-directed RNA polymerase [Bertholletia excelsa]
MGKTIDLFGFPRGTHAEKVKEFIEQLTGRGTVYALEIKEPRKGGSKVYARIQFLSAILAEDIISLANKSLYYEFSQLQAYQKNFDIEPKVDEHVIESVTLHLGCQISKENFSVLWTRENISVKFGFKLRKLYFFLSYYFAEYKLELSYENILQLELHSLHGQTVKFLVIQLLGAPRIYEKNEECHEECVMNFYKETPDDMWVRTTDFTPSRCIGHSSTLCLELSYDALLLNLYDYFPSYKEYEGPYVLERRSTLAHNMDLVPIISPLEGFELPYKILFKICMLVQQGFLPGPALDTNFFQLVDPRIVELEYIESALEKMFSLKECCYDPASWLWDQYVKYHTSKPPPRAPAVALKDGLVYVRRAQITPCKVFFWGPEKNMSNRVLRHFHEDIDNFLRVSFVDEELNKLHSTDLAPRVTLSNGERRTGIYRRILSTLRDGILIGNKKFDFLAFSSSQLKENSLWMFASRDGLTAADIRKWMGDFHQIRNVAKYAARLGQSFSSSKETMHVGRDEIEIIPDVENVGNGVKYVFSDGIGKISINFAKSMALKCGLKCSTPSAFQIRYGGYKGVVAVDPTSSANISLRKSMCKYESDNTSLDVLNWSKYHPCFLNRQLITLLSTLGVEDHIFERKQREVVDELNSILEYPSRAQEVLGLMAPGENTNILKEMLSCGYRPDTEPFLSMMLKAFRGAKLLDLRTKARIFVPQGRLMMGCLDETRTLQYGEVFVQCSGAGHGRFCANSHYMVGGSSSENDRFVVKDKVVVAKNPCLHPGDVRVLRAVDVPALHHMVDCVVFPQRGIRPHPNECSGSDLDGDLYFVCWDYDLIPPWQQQPMDYTPAQSIKLDHDVTIEEVQRYFADYIVNDTLGVVDNAHLVYADREPQKAMSDPCIKLAKLHSDAVDFAKTGVPAEISRDLIVKEFPDFMEKNDKASYESTGVLGKLYRAVKDKAPDSIGINSFSIEVAFNSYDYDLEVDGFQDYTADAFEYKNEYDRKLGNLMEYFGIKTEAEILSVSILKTPKSSDRRKDAEDINWHVRTLRKDARSFFNQREMTEDLDAKASAWYHVTYHPSYWGLYNEGRNHKHFISFPWCVYDKLLSIKKKKSRRLSSSSLLE